MAAHPPAVRSHPIPVPTCRGGHAIVSRLIATVRVCSDTRRRPPSPPVVAASTRFAGLPDSASSTRSTSVRHALKT